MAPGCPPATGKTRTRVRANHAVNHVERASERASYPPVPSPRRLGTVLCLKWYTRMSGGTYYAVEAPCCDVGEAFCFLLFWSSRGAGPLATRAL